MLTRYWWLRHGPTHQTTICGWRDVAADLSDHAALARLRRFLPIAPVISSDLLRARQTADAIAGSRRRLAADPDLREFNFGQWDGQSFAEIAAVEPDLSRRYWEEPGDIAPPDGESWNAAAARVDRAIRRLDALKYPDIIIVAHFGVILTRLQQDLATDAKTVLAQKIDPLSVTCLTGSPGLPPLWINHRP